MIELEDQGGSNDQAAEREVAQIRGALRRVPHPLYRYLIAALVDTITLRIAAVEANALRPIAANDSSPEVSDG